MSSTESLLTVVIVSAFVSIGMYVFCEPKFTNCIFFVSNERSQARSGTSHGGGPCCGDLPAEIPQGSLQDLGSQPPGCGHVGLF